MNASARAAYSGILSLALTGLATALRDPTMRGLVGAAPLVPALLILAAYHAKRYSGIKAMSGVAPMAQAAAMWIALAAPLAYIGLLAAGLPQAALGLSAALSVWLLVHGVSLSK